MIEIEDLKDLVIDKKFVHVENTNLYTDEAYQYLKNLVDANRSLIFEKNTHRIYVLGQYYGGDELKENLLYFSKILSIDINNEIISEIDAIKNEDTLAFKAKDNVSLNIERKDNYTEIEIGYDINNIVDKSPVLINNNEYNLNIDGGKIKLNEYVYPEISIEDFVLTYEELDENNRKEIELTINSSIDIDDFEKFDIFVEDAILINKYKNTINIQVIKDINPTIIVDYNDGVKENQVSFTLEWTLYCYYGIIGETSDELVETGKYIIKNDSIDNMITIDQPLNYYGYYMCPANKYKPFFIDNISRIQGAWNAKFLIEKDLTEYIVYFTDNSGLGQIEWEIINKN